jgi:hypothetical protein
MYFFCESILCYHSLYRFIIFHVIRTRDKREQIVQSTHRIRTKSMCVIDDGREKEKKMNR